MGTVIRTKQIATNAHTGITEQISEIDRQERNIPQVKTARTPAVIEIDVLANKIPRTFGSLRIRTQILNDIF